MPPSRPPTPDSTDAPYHFSVHVIGLDSVSRLNFHRLMPRTRSFLRRELGAIEFLAYNKVGRNTFPNWMPLHTGWPLVGDGEPKRRKTKTNDKDSEDAQNNHTPIWTEYAARGFWTLYGEDWELSPWALQSRGHPWDYRYRTMVQNNQESKNAVMGHSLIRLLAPLPSLTHLLAPHCSLHSRTPLAHSRDSE